MKRKSIVILLSVLLSFLIFGCGDQEQENQSKNENEEAAEETEMGKISVWSTLSQEEMNYYVSLYKEANPDGAEVEVTCIPEDDYVSKLQAAFAAGEEVGDVMYIEITNFGVFKETGVLETLNDYAGAESILEEQYEYVSGLSKNNAGEIKGISYQATPGGLWYRRDLAEKYLGVSEPEDVQEFVKDWDTLIETGEKVYEASGGEVALLDDATTVWTIMQYNAKGGPWVDPETNTLLADSKIANIFQLAKNIRDNNVDAKLTQWDASWTAGIYDSEKYIMMGLPSWGLPYVIKANTPEDKWEEVAGNWGLVEAPQTYYSGGTWLCMSATSKNKEGAWDFIKTMTSDQNILTEGLIEYEGDFVSNREAIQKAIDEGHTDQFLGDQNYFEVFDSIASNITAVPTTKYDTQCVNSFEAVLSQMLNGDLTVDEAVASFKADVQNVYPELAFEEDR